MKPSSSHRGDIQGLRAVAVLLVALAHAHVGFLRGGFVGVDVFFVLSGFLITGILLAEARAHGSISLIGFYVRRARRILPAAILTLVMTNVAVFVLLNFLRAREAVRDSLSATAFAANFHFAARGTDYFAQSQPPSPLLHLWSLAVEEQFYLVWPAVLSLAALGIALRRRRRSLGTWQERRLLLVVCMIVVLSLVWSVRVTGTGSPAAYFSPFTRAWELGLGAMLAIAVTRLASDQSRWRVPIGWAGIGAIVAAAVVFSEGTAFPGYAALLPTLGAALVIGAGVADVPSRVAVGRVLQLAPMRFIGDRSYAFYLWHWPVLIIAAQFVGHDLSVAENLVLLLCAFLLSIVSYGLVENPIRRASWSPRTTTVAFGTSLGVALATAVVLLAAIDRKEQHFYAAASVTTAPSEVVVADTGGALPEVVAAVRAARRGDAIPPGLTPPIGELTNEPQPYSLPRGCVPIAASNESTSKICPIGRTSSRTTIVVIGDSHVQMWMPAILHLANQDGWRVIPLLRPGCTPGAWVDHDGLAACRKWYKWAIRQVGLLHPTVTLIGGAVGGDRGGTAGEAVHGIVSMARTLRSGSRKVIVIGDPEGLDLNPLDCLLARNASMRSCTTTWPQAALWPYDTIASRTKTLGVGFLDTRGWFCFQAECPAVIGRTIVYKDPHHVTVAYVQRRAATFRGAFRRAIRRR